MLNEFERPSFEACRDRSSLLLLHKIYFGALSINNDKYLTPAHSSKATSHHIAPNIVDTRQTVMPWRTLFLWTTVEQSFSFGGQFQTTEEFRAWHSSFSQKHCWKIFFPKFKNMHSLAYGVMIELYRASNKRKIDCLIICPVSSFDISVHVIKQI